MFGGTPSKPHVFIKECLVYAIGTALYIISSAVFVKLNVITFLYSYYLPDINSIKVGHGDLIIYSPSSGIIENSCHHAIKSGFVRSKLR